MTPEKIRDTFAHHPPSPAKAQQHDQVREYMIATAVAIADLLPESRERSLFLTKMQEAQMFANAAIAIHS